MQINNHQTTIDDVLDAVNKFATTNEQRLGRIEDDLDSMKSDINGMKRTMTTLVTKDYLDEKIADLRGDLVVLIRKEDKKFSALIDVLKYRQVISNDEATKILSMEPFPQLAL